VQNCYNAEKVHSSVAPSGEQELTQSYKVKTIARDSTIMLSPIRPSVCLSVCHTGESYKKTVAAVRIMYVVW